EVLPGTGGAQHIGLATQAAVGAHLARHAGDLAREGIELIDHAVDGVLEVEDLAADVDRDLLGQVAVGDGGRYLGDVAHVRRQIAGHEIDVVGEVLPDADYAANLGLPTQPTLSTDFTGDARNLGGEGVELIDHDVDRVLQLEDFALDVDRDLFRQVTT